MRSTINNTQDEPALFIGGAKNVHGTLFRRRIVCTECGRLDYIAKCLGKKNRAFCRLCAKTFLGIHEVGTQLQRKTVQRTCAKCNEPFQLPAEAKVKKDVWCSDCLKGFDVWRGFIGESADLRRNAKLEVREAGTLLRRQNRI